MLDKHKWILASPELPISLNGWQHTINLLAEVYAAPVAFLVQYTPDGFQVVIANQEKQIPYAPGYVIPPETNSFCRRVVETQQLLYVANALTEPEWQDNPTAQQEGLISYLGVPVRWPDGTPFGTFCVLDRQETSYNPLYIRLIHQLRDILEADLHLLNAYHRVQSMAMTDELTALYNRRGFFNLAEQRILLARRTDTPLCLLYFDVDGFKSVNDEHGHQIGDAVLAAVAAALKQSLRGSDIVGRLGGDEFAAIALVTDIEEIGPIKERFNDHLHQSLSHSSLPLTNVSIGEAMVDIAQGCLEKALSEADTQMYQHKKSRSHH